MIIVISIVLGVALALALNVYIPASLSPYVAIIILAALDSVFGAYRSTLEKKFEPGIFITGLFGNALLAAFLTFIGKKLDVDIHLAAVIVFGSRLFHNFAYVRRYYLGVYLTKKRLKSGAEEEK